MLSKYLKKTIKQSQVVNKLRSKDTVLTPFKEDFDTNLPEMNMDSRGSIIRFNSIMTERIDRVEGSISNSSPQNKEIGRRHSLLMQRYSMDNKKFTTEMLESKIKKIKELEEKIKNVNSCLYDLVLNLKDSLILDEEFDKELKNLLFSESTLSKIKESDCVMTVELIKTIIDNTLNLKSKLKEISKTDYSMTPTDEVDYILLMKKMEGELRESKKTEQNCKFIIEMAKIRSYELETQNKLILEKTNSILVEWKQDYLKLIDVLKEKEKDLNTINGEVTKKKEKIFNLEDKLLSIGVLEHKIGCLNEQFNSETKRLINNYEQKLKETNNFYKFNPAITKNQQEKDNKIHKLNEMLTYEGNDKRKLILGSELNKKLHNAEILKLKKIIYKQNIEIEELKSKIVEKNKEYFKLANTSYIERKENFFNKRAFSVSEQEKIKKNNKNNINTLFLTNYQH